MSIKTSADLQKEMMERLKRMSINTMFECDGLEQEETFENKLIHLLNSYSMENGSNTPDFILAKYLINCLDNLNKTVKSREKWYGRTGSSLEQFTVQHDHHFDEADGRCDCGIHWDEWNRGVNNHD